MPVSKAIDFIKHFGMFVIIWSMFVGVSPLYQVGFLMRCSKTHKNFVIEYYRRLYSNHQAKHNFCTKCYKKYLHCKAHLGKNYCLSLGIYMCQKLIVSFPRFMSNVSISMEDVNWKVSLFLHGMFWLI